MKEKGTLSKDAQAIHLIKEALFDRKLSPGQKILYRDLEEMLGMSKTPIINALIRLEQEGLVVSHRNRGFYVREHKAGEIEQMYDLRVRLEEIAIDYAIDYGRQKDLISLKKALDDYLAYPAQVYDAHRFKLDTAFHLGVAQISHNQFLISMLYQFYQSAWIGFHISFLTPLIPRFKQDHERLYQAILEKNRKEAKQIMRLHFKDILNLLKDTSMKGGKGNGKPYE